MEYLIAAIVIMVILLSLSIIAFIGAIKTKNWVCIILGTICVIMSIVGGIAIISEIKNIQPEPTAIDVYRGSDKLEKITELEITSVDGVPTDTFVVVILKK